MSALLQPFLLVMILLAGLVDIPRMLNFGPFSGLALLTIIATLCPLFLWASHPKLYRDALAKLWPMVALVSLGLLPLTWQGPSMLYIQNILVYAAFLFLALLAYNCSRLSPSFSRRLRNSLGLAAGVSLALYAFGLAKGGLGSDAVIGPRAFALFALIGLSGYLASWRYGDRKGAALAIATPFFIGLSLSRLALVGGILLFPLASLSHRDRWTWLRTGVTLALAAGTLWLTILNVEPLRERFLSGDTSLQMGGVAINASGRTAIWAAIWDSYLESPLIGKGIGSADDFTSIRFPSDTVCHPHCDYLRILHDLGAIGLFLWIFGFVLLLRATWKAWRYADLGGLPSAALHMTAFLSLIALAQGMATDNAMIYLFIMAPVGILVGSSLGASLRDLQEVAT